MASPLGNPEHPPKFRHDLPYPEKCDKRCILFRNPKQCQNSTCHFKKERFAK